MPLRAFAALSAALAWACSSTDGEGTALDAAAEAGSVAGGGAEADGGARPASDANIADAALPADAGPPDLDPDAGATDASAANTDAATGELPRFVQLDLGDEHACAVTDGGELYCWGGNHYGQLGLPAEVPLDPCPGFRPAPELCKVTPTRVPDLQNVVQVAAGGYATCALLADGGVRCFGSNRTGELGVALEDVGLCDQSVRFPTNQTEQPCSHEPVAVPGVDDAREIRVGYSSACALREGGQVTCWGGEGLASIDDPDLAALHCPDPLLFPSASIPCALPPHPIAIEGDVVDLAVGNADSFALRADGSVVQWGMRARHAVALPPTRSIQAGNHACAVLRDGGIECWGENQFGQLGLGCGDMRCDPPVTLASMPDGVQLALGLSFTCGLDGDGAIYCLGHYPAGTPFFGPPYEGEYCAPCSGTCRSCNAPTLAYAPDPRRVHLEAGNGFLCALTDDGGFQCVGTNAMGQLGNGLQPDLVRDSPILCPPGFSDCDGIELTGCETEAPSC